MGKGIKDFGRVLSGQLEWEIYRKQEAKRRKRDNYRRFMNRLYQAREKEFNQATNEWNKIYKND